MEILFTILGGIWTIAAISAWAENKFDEIKAFALQLGIGLSIVILPWIVGHYSSDITTKIHTGVTKHDKTTYATPVTYKQEIKTAPFWSCQDSNKWELVDGN